MPIDLGIASGALSDLAAIIRDQAETVGTATLERLGHLSARLDAAETLFADALDRLRALEGRALTLEETQGFSLEVSIVKVLAGELALDIAEELLEVAGPAALDLISGSTGTGATPEPIRCTTRAAGATCASAPMP